MASLSIRTIALSELEIPFPVTLLDRRQPPLERWSTGPQAWIDYDIPTYIRRGIKPSFLEAGNANPAEGKS